MRFIGFVLIILFFFSSLIDGCARPPNWYFFQNKIVLSNKLLIINTAYASISKPDPGREPGADYVVLCHWLRSTVSRNLIRLFTIQDAEVRQIAREMLFRLRPESVEPLVQALSEYDMDIRVHAAKVLGRIGDPKTVNVIVKNLLVDNRYVAIDALKGIGGPAVAPLLISLHDENPGIRRGAAEALGFIGDVSVVDTLLSLLGYETDANVRIGISSGLGRIGNSAVEPLLKALQNENPTVMQGAVRALGFTHDPRVIDPLCRKLCSANGSIRAVAADALVEIGEPAVSTLIELMYGDRNHSKVGDILGKIGDPRAIPVLLTYGNVEALIGIGEPAVQSIVEALSHGDAGVRIQAARVLGQIRDPRSIEPLERVLLYDPNRGVRAEAALALAGIGNDQVMNTLVGSLRIERSRIVRSQIASALGFMGKGALKPLLSIISDPDAMVRVRVLQSLEQLGDKEAIPLIIPALKDKNIEVRKSAVSALGHLGEGSDLIPLASMFDDSETGIRCDAIRALQSNPDPILFKSLIHGLQNSQVCVRIGAANLLAKMDDTRAIEPMEIAFVDAIRTNDRGFVSVLEHALDSLEQSEYSRWCLAVGCPDFDVRMRAVIQLAKIKDIRSLPALIDALDDEDERIRKRAAAAIRNLGDLAADDLMELLEDERPLVRSGAAWVLVRLGTAYEEIVLSEVRRTNDLAIIAATYKNLLLAGETDMDSDLIRTLHEFGDVEMAQYFLNSGRTDLEKAAREWGESRNYSITSSSKEK